MSGVTFPSRYPSSDVAITGGTITGITDLAVADGGTGSSTAAAAATALGLGTADAVRHARLGLGASADATEPLKLIDGGNIILGTTTGTMLGTTSSQKIGFWGITPIVQPSAYTQTYSTADKTHATLTSASIGAFTGGVVGFLDAAERDNVRTQVNNIRGDILDVKQLVNSIIDDLQAMGLLS